MSIYDCIHSAMCYAEDIHAKEITSVLRQALEELPPMPQPIPLGVPVAVDITQSDTKLLTGLMALLHADGHWDEALALRQLIMRMIDVHPSLHPEAQ